MTLTVFPRPASTVVSVSRGDCSSRSPATTDDSLAVTSTESIPSTESPKTGAADKVADPDSTLLALGFPFTALIVLLDHTLWAAAGECERVATITTKNEKKRFSRKGTRQNLKTSQNEEKKGKKKREPGIFFGGTAIWRYFFGGTSI